MAQQDRIPFKSGERDKVIARFIKTFAAEEDQRRKLKELTEQLNALAETCEANGNKGEDLGVLGKAAADQHKAEEKLRSLTKKRKEQWDAIRHNGWLSEDQLELGVAHPDDVLDEDDAEDKPAGVKRRAKANGAAETQA